MRKDRIRIRDILQLIIGIIIEIIVAEYVFISNFSYSWYTGIFIFFFCIPLTCFFWTMKVVRKEKFVMFESRGVSIKRVLLIAIFTILIGTWLFYLPLSLISFLIILLFFGIMLLLLKGFFRILKETKKENIRTRKKEEVYENIRRKIERENKDYRQRIERVRESYKESNYKKNDDTSEKTLELKNSKHEERSIAERNYEKELYSFNGFYNEKNDDEVRVKIEEELCSKF